MLCDSNTWFSYVDLKLTSAQSYFTSQSSSKDRVVSVYAYSNLVAEYIENKGHDFYVYNTIRLQWPKSILCMFHVCSKERVWFKGHGYFFSI